MINCYQILEIRPTTSSDVIKKAYYQLAKIYHPDGQNPDVNRFQLLKRAFIILSDSSLKKQHDLYWNINEFNHTDSKSHQVNPSIDFKNIANQFLLNQVSAFGQDLNKGAGAPQNIVKKSDPTPDIVINYQLSFSQFWTGGQLVLDYYYRQFENFEQAPPVSDLNHYCLDCNGLGYQINQSNLKSGFAKPCISCQATGFTNQIKHLDISIKQRNLVTTLVPTLDRQLIIPHQGHRRWDGTFTNLVINLVVKPAQFDAQIIKIKSNDFRQPLVIQLHLPIGIRLYLNYFKVLTPWSELVEFKIQTLATSKQTLTIYAKEKLWKKWIDRYDCHPTLVQNRYQVCFEFIWDLTQYQREQTFKWYQAYLMKLVNFHF